MPETGSSPSSHEQTIPAPHVNVAYGIVHSDHQHAIDITTRKGFPLVYKDHATQQPDIQMVLPYTSTVQTVRGDNDTYTLTVDEPYEVVKPLEHHDQAQGKALILHATTNGTYEVSQAETGATVNFSKGDIVLLLQGSALRTDQLDAILEKWTPRIVSKSNDPELVIKDLVNAFDQHGLIREQDLHFAIMAHEGKHAKPLSLLQILLLAKQRAERSWGKQKIESPSVTLSGDIPRDRAVVVYKEPEVLTPAQALTARVLAELDASAKGDYLNQVPDESKAYVEHLASENWKLTQYRMTYGTYDRFKQEMARNWETKRRSFIALAELRGLEEIKPDATIEDLNNHRIIALTSSGSKVVIGKGAYDSEKGASFLYEKIPLRHGELSAPHNQKKPDGKFLSPDSIPKIGKRLKIYRSKRAAERMLGPFMTSPLLLLYKTASAANQEDEQVALDEFLNGLTESVAHINNHSLV